MRTLCRGLETDSKTGKPFFTQIFQGIDQSGNNQVERHELKEALERLELPRSADDLDAIFEKYDADKDATLSLGEFRHWLSSYMHGTFHSYLAELASDPRFIFTSPESLGTEHREQSVVPEIEKLCHMVETAAEERGMLLGSVQDLLTVLGGELKKGKKK